MAENASNDLNYFIRIDQEHKSDLEGIRHWNNLKIAFEEQSIWIKDFDYVQINSLEVKSIPYKSIYYSKQAKLFPQNSLLPERNVPSLLWTPIERALPIKLPAFNHNYFGVEERLSIKIVSSEVEIQSEAMITSIGILGEYIEQAPAIRTQSLKWTILNNDLVLILGKPLLPINGNVYWKRNDFLLPAGFDFELFILSESLNRLLNHGNQFLIVWNTDNTYAIIEKSDLQKLSLSSFRISAGKIISNE